MVLQLKIQIQGISKPPVWRKVLVPTQFSFDKLHQVIQAAFGWYDYHLYSFSPTGYGSSPEIGLPDDEGWSDEEILNSKKVKLAEIFKVKGQRFTYIYDFGDNWVHKITIEDVLDQKATKAQLISGKGACPPEDCGGVWGYQNLVEVMGNPNHPEYGEMREWLGFDDDETWDVHEFNLEIAQENVSAIR